MRWLRPTSLGLVFLIVAQVATVVVISAIIFQPLNILLDQQGLPVGVIASVYPATTLVCGLLFGSLTDKYGPERILFVLMPCITGVYLLYPFAHTTVQHIAIRVLHGLLFAIVSNSLIVLVRKRIASASPIFQGWVQALIIGLYYAGFGVATYYGLELVNNPLLLWSSVASIGGLTMVLVYWGIVISGSSRMTLRPPINRELTSVSGVTKGLFDKDALIVALPDVGVSACFWAYLTWFALFIGKHAGLILLWSMGVICFTVLTVMPKIVVSVGYRFVMGWSIVILMVSILLIRISGQGSFWLLMLAGLLMGVAIAGNNLSISIEVQRRVHPERLGKGVATSRFLKQLGIIIGPSYSGLVWSVWGANIMWLSLIPLLLLSMAPLFLKQKVVTLVTFVSRKDQLCCLRALAVHAVIRGDEGQFLEMVKEIRMASSPLELKPGERLMCEKDHVAFAVVLLERVQEARIDVSSVEEEIKSLNRRLKGLLEEQFGEMADQLFYNSILNGRRIDVEAVKTPEDAHRYLSAVVQLGLPGLNLIRLECIVEALSFRNGIEETRSLPTQVQDNLQVAA